MKITQPTYTTVLPSTGKQVSFRPYVVKEEKALLIALQSESVSNIIAVLKENLKSCIVSDVDVDSLPYFDIEYMYLMLRAKSVGENVEMVGGCTCSPDAKTKFVIDLEETFVGDINDTMIKIEGTDYGMILRYPTPEEMFDLADDETEKDAIESVAQITTQIFDSENVYDDKTLEERIEFVESLTPSQQKNIAEWLNNMPVVRVPYKYTCKECGKEHDSTMRGLENFFL